MTDIVVGAGLGGLSVASAMTAAGRSVRVLEAKPRCGGRIKSVPHSPGSVHAVDLGPTWFWPHQRRVRALCDRLQVGVFEQHAVGATLYQLAPSSIQRAHGPAPPSFRIEGGTTRLIDALCSALPPETVTCDCRVVQVARSAGLWQLMVQTDAGRELVSTPTLVIAVPPRVWLGIDGAGACFSTALNQALAATPTWMAAQARFVATYERAFWREQGLCGDAFSRVGPMAEVHDASASPEANAALFGFLGVPAPARQGLGEERLVELCIDQLAALFGEQARNFTATYLKDWAADRCIATQVDIAGPHAHPELDLRPYLAELHRLRCSFASTEAAAEEGGYLEGALAAAEQASYALTSRV